MKRFRPYLAFDLETTGLCTDRSQILEIGAIFDDATSPIDQLKTYNAKIKYEHLEYAELYALNMNKDLIGELARRTPQPNVTNFQGAILGLLVFIANAVEEVKHFEDLVQRRKYPDHRIHLAGKNIGNFDDLILRNQIKKHLGDVPDTDYDKQSLADTCLEEYKELVHFRFVDIGSLYLAEFEGYSPSMSDINTLIGREKISHKAIDDCLDVVHAIRYKYR